MIFRIQGRNHTLYTFVQADNTFKRRLLFVIVERAMIFFYSDNVCVEIQVLMILSSHNTHYKLRNVYMTIKCLNYTCKEMRSVAIICSHNTCYKMRLRGVYVYIITIICSQNKCYKLRSVNATIRCLHNTHCKLGSVYTTIRCLHNEHSKLSLI